MLCLSEPQCNHLHRRKRYSDKKKKVIIAPIHPVATSETLLLGYYRKS